MLCLASNLSRLKPVPSGDGRGCSVVDWSLLWTCVCQADAPREGRGLRTGVPLPASSFVCLLSFTRSLSSSCPLRCSQLMQGLAWLMAPALKTGAAAVAPFSGESLFLHAARTLLENLVSTTLVLPLGLYVLLDIQRVFTPAVLYRRQRKSNCESSRDAAAGTGPCSWQRTDTNVGVAGNAAAPSRSDIARIGLAKKKEEGPEGLGVQPEKGNSAVEAPGQRAPPTLQRGVGSFAWSFKGRPRQCLRRSYSALDLPVQRECANTTPVIRPKDTSCGSFPGPSEHRRSHHVGERSLVSVQGTPRAAGAHPLPYCSRVCSVDCLERKQPGPSRSCEPLQSALPESSKSQRAHESHNCASSQSGQGGAPGSCVCPGSLHFSSGQADARSRRSDMAVGCCSEKASCYIRNPLDSRSPGLNNVQRDTTLRLPQDADIGGGRTERQCGMVTGLRISLASHVERMQGRASAPEPTADDAHNQTSRGVAPRDHRKAPSQTDPRGVASSDCYCGSFCDGHAIVHHTRPPSHGNLSPASSPQSASVACRCSAAGEGSSGSAEARRGAGRALQLFAASIWSLRAFPKRIVEFIAHRLGLDFCAAFDILEHCCAETPARRGGSSAGIKAPFAESAPPTEGEEPYGLVRNSHCLGSLGVVDFAFLAAPTTRQFSFAACYVGGVLYESRDAGVPRRMFSSSGKPADGSEDEREAETWSLTVNCSRQGPASCEYLRPSEPGVSASPDKTVEPGAAFFPPRLETGARHTPHLPCSRSGKADLSQRLKEQSYAREKEVSCGRGNFAEPLSSSCLCIACQFGGSDFLSDYIGNGLQRRRLQEMGRALALCHMAEPCQAGNLLTASPACCPQSGARICSCTSTCTRESKSAAGGGNLLSATVHSPVLSQAASISSGWSPLHTAGATNVSASHVQSCQWEWDSTGKVSCLRSANACRCGSPVYPQERSVACRLPEHLTSQELSVCTCTAGSETAKVVLPSVSCTPPFGRCGRPQAALSAAVCTGSSLRGGSSLDMPVFCACGASRSSATETRCPDTPVSPSRQMCGAWEVAAAAAVAAAANSARLPVVEERSSRTTGLRPSPGGGICCSCPRTGAAGSLNRRPSLTRRIPEAEPSAFSWSSRGTPGLRRVFRRASSGSRRASGDHSSADDDSHVTPNEGQRAPRCAPRSSRGAVRRPQAHPGDGNSPFTLTSESPADLCLLQFASLLGYLPVARSATEVVVRCHLPFAVAPLRGRHLVSNPGIHRADAGVRDPVSDVGWAVPLSGDSAGQLELDEECVVHSCWSEAQRLHEECCAKKSASSRVASGRAGHEPLSAGNEGSVGSVQHDVMPDKMDLTLGSPLPPPAVDADLRSPLSSLLKPLMKESSATGKEAKAGGLTSPLAMPETSGVPADNQRVSDRPAAERHSCVAGVGGQATSGEVLCRADEVQRMLGSLTHTEAQAGVPDSLKTATAPGHERGFPVPLTSSAATEEVESRADYSHSSRCVAAAERLCACALSQPSPAVDWLCSTPARGKEVDGADFRCLCASLPPRLFHTNGRSCCAEVHCLPSTLHSVTSELWEPFLLGGRGVPSSHRVQGMKTELSACVTAPVQREPHVTSGLTPGPCKEHTAEQPGRQPNRQERTLPCVILSEGLPTYLRFRVLGVHPPEPGRLRMSVIVREEGCRDAVLYTRGDLADIGPRCSCPFVPGLADSGVEEFTGLSVNGVAGSTDYADVTFKSRCTPPKQVRSRWRSESGGRLVQGSSSRAGGIDQARGWSAAGGALRAKSPDLADGMLKCILRNAEMLINDGLRPLVVARRVLTEGQVEAYQQAVEDAKSSMFSQKSKLCAAIRSLEQDFEVRFVNAVSNPYCVPRLRGCTPNFRRTESPGPPPLAREATNVASARPRHSRRC